MVKMLAHRREILNGSGGSFRPAANHCGSSHITAWSALIRGSPATTFTLNVDDIYHARDTYAHFLRGPATIDCPDPIGLGD